MKPSLSLPRVALLLALAGFASVHLAAQTVLFAEMGGKFLPVRRVKGTSPMVLVDGKLVMTGTVRFALQKVEEYRPEFINVAKMDASTRYLNVEGAAINNDFLFSATVDTPYYLEDVFIVLELDTEIAGKVLFAQEIGTLEPHKTKTISIGVPISGQLGEGRYKFHFFSGGLEVMHTRMPALQRDRLVDRMIFNRLAGVTDATPTLFTGPPPEYPAALLKSRVTGQAVITLRLGANGQVYDPQVKRATDPAFGESALTAVRLWRFLPRVKNGRPVETRIDVPIDFTPPEKKS